MDLRRITVDHQIMGGVPCVAGTRIPVATVVGLVANGLTTADIIAEYPQLTLADVAAACAATGDQLGLSVDVRQTDDEAELISWAHEAADGQLPVVLNPAAFTHYSYALHDALAMRTAPLVEVHLSNPATREAFRHTSVVASVADGTVTRPTGLSPVPGARKKVPDSR